MLMRESGGFNVQDAAFLFRRAGGCRNLDDNVTNLQLTSTTTPMRIEGTGNHDRMRISAFGKAYGQGERLL